MLPASIHRLVEEKVGTIRQINSIHGGSINRAVRIDTINQRYFFKWNSAQLYPGMFDVEREGLNELGEYIPVPEVLCQISTQDASGLLMSYVNTERGTSKLWAEAGKLLAEMHLNKQSSFGGRDNYMGSLPQSNSMHSDFPTFFREERLKPCVTLAKNQGLLEAGDLHRFDQLYAKLEDLVSDQKPCLVHGDLWGGNLIFDLESPFFIDPAVAVSSRHCDLAMTTMFGKFPDGFYDAYREVFPYTDEDEKQWDLFNLYPLLVHVVLFGSAYLHDTRSVLRYYVG